MSAAFVQAIHVHQFDVPRAPRLGGQLGVETRPAEEEEPGRWLVHDSPNVTQALELTKSHRLRTPLGIANGQDTLLGVGRAFDRDHVELVLVSMLGTVDLGASHIIGGSYK